MSNWASHGRLAGSVLLRLIIDVEGSVRAGPLLMAIFMTWLVPDNVIITSSPHRRHHTGIHSLRLFLSHSSDGWEERGERDERDEKEEREERDERMKGGEGREGWEGREGGDIFYSNNMEIERFDRFELQTWFIIDTLIRLSRLSRIR